MTQLAETPGPVADGVRNVTVSILDVTAPTPELRALLRDRAGLTAAEAAEFYGPARLPHGFSAAEARSLVSALERLGVAARTEEPAQAWAALADAPELEVIQHPGVREHF